MTEKIKCPVCGKELKIINMSHISSKSHQKALEKKKIDPDDDPALEFISDLKEDYTDEIKTKTKEKESEMIKKNNKVIDEDSEFSAPEIPPPPKKSDLTLDVSNLSLDVINKMKELENDKTKVVLSRCRICEKVIPVPIPKELVLNSDLPVVPISFIHKKPNNKDIHCITLHLDHDFDIRRQKISDVILGDNIP